MKQLLILLTVLNISCSSENSFIYNSWQLGETEGISELKIDINEGITWTITGVDLMKNSNFSILEQSEDTVIIESDYSKDSSSLSNPNDLKARLKLIKIDNENCIVVTYKSNIQENRIDEIGYARAASINDNQIEIQPNQLILLPDDYIGKFYIIYEESKKNNDSKLKINKKGIGLSQAFPNLKQLFNANRNFQYYDSNENISLINPKGYYFRESIFDNVEDDELVVIQLGFNQEARTYWNYDNQLNIQSNIEFFEIGFGRDIKNKYAM